MYTHFIFAASYWTKDLNGKYKIHFFIVFWIYRVHSSRIFMLFFKVLWTWKFIVLIKDNGFFSVFAWLTLNHRTWQQHYKSIGVHQKGWKAALVVFHFQGTHSNLEILTLSFNPFPLFSLRFSLLNGKAKGSWSLNWC